MLRISLLRRICVRQAHAWSMWLCMALTVCIMLQPAASWAAEWNIDQLMQSLAKNKVGRATFVEKKYIAMLDRPVESSGELSYAAPDHLEKRTLRPQPAGFIDSIRGTLAGDRKALERTFNLKLEGNASRWTLWLKPTDPRTARAVHLIRIGGAAGEGRGSEI